MYISRISRLGNITNQPLHSLFCFCLKKKIVANLSFFCNRLDLCNSWDKETVKSSSIKTLEGHIDPKQVVFFYAIDCTNKPVKPVEINPKPKAIKAAYKIYSRNSKFLLASRNSANYPQRIILFGPALLSRRKSSGDSPETSCGDLQIFWLNHW